MPPRLSSAPAARVPRSFWTAMSQRLSAFSPCRPAALPRRFGLRGLAWNCVDWRAFFFSRSCTAAFSAPAAPARPASAPPSAVAGRALLLAGSLSEIQKSCAWLRLVAFFLEGRAATSGGSVFRRRLLRKPSQVVDHLLRVLEAELLGDAGVLPRQVVAA